MKRRSFIAGFGSTVAWPVVARAQAAPPAVIGYLAQGTQEGSAEFVSSVRKGLGEAGLVEGKDFTGRFGWARFNADLLSPLAIDLVQRQVAVIITLDTVAAARAAKTATMMTPIVFVLGSDPVQAGLVASLNRPGGNVTGISTMNLDLGSKWVGLLRELQPMAKRFAVLVNIVNTESARSLITGTQTAALTIGVQIEFVFASTEEEIDAAFARLGGRSQGLIIHPDSLFTQHRERLAALAIREKLPALYSTGNFPEAGGLMSYGSSFLDAHRQASRYAGRILKGDKPADLPVEQSTKLELLINMKTAKALGLTVPETLLATADEVIE